MTPDSSTQMTWIFPQLFRILGLHPNLEIGIFIFAIDANLIEIHAVEVNFAGIWQTICVEYFPYLPLHAQFDEILAEIFEVKDN